MKINLENKKTWQRYDKGQALASINQLSNQCGQALKEIRKIRIPRAFKKVKNIIVCGMGGSTLGSDLIRATFNDCLRVPFYIVNDYNLPSFTNQDSLIISVSYSGDTEESVSATRQAIKRGYKIFVITTDGKLATLVRKYHLPAYIFKPYYNPSGQPRLGLGYPAFSQLEILRRLDLINLAPAAPQRAIRLLEKSAKSFQETVKNNPAKKLAHELYGRIPVIFAGNYLLGNAHILANQINENAKNFACYFAMPELNHHLLEGLTHPVCLRHFVFILLESDFDSPPIKKRFSATKKILQKKKLAAVSLKVKGSDRLSQSMWLLAFGSYVSFYLTMLNQENPVAIPWVKLLKKELTKK